MPRRSKMTPEELASRLRRIRRTEALTQCELAARSGVSVMVISAFERGSRKNISVMQLVALVDACDWEIGSFMGRSFKQALSRRRSIRRLRMRFDDEQMDRRALAMMRKCGDSRRNRPRQLAEVIVDEICEQLRAGTSQSTLAREHGVTRQAIWLIAHQRHVDAVPQEVVA